MVETAAASWAAAELGGANLGDARLNRRLVRVAERLGAQPGASIPVACGGWAETQGAYRLLAHEAVDWEAVLTPHWDCSIERMRGQPVVLCVQDSTELNYTSQPGIAGLGPLSDLRQHGLYVHPTLAVTPDGVPLGVLDAWMWARDRATFGEDKRHWPIEAKESMRWLEGFARCAELAETLPDTRLIYVADRECDIHEFMVRARREPGIDWLIRATHDRCLAEGDKLWSRLVQAPLLGEVAFTLPARPNRPSRPVVLTVRAERVILSPKGGRTGDGHRAAGARSLRARRGRTARLAPADQSPGHHLGPGGRVAQMVRKPLEHRGFFRIFKTGCRVEALQLSTVERLEPALALYLIIAWRIQYLTALGRGRHRPAVRCGPGFGRMAGGLRRDSPPPSTSPLAVTAGHARLDRPAWAVIWGANAMDHPVPKPSGSTCSARAISPGGWNWLPISMPNQPVRDVWNRQGLKEGGAPC
jgi:hypothetical protein